MSLRQFTRRYIWWHALLVGLASLASRPMVAQGASARPILGELAPEIEGKDVDGASFQLSDYRGKIVVLSFWGDWCPFCRVMYTHERELVERLNDEPFVLIGVNSDPEDRLRGVLKSEKITWRSFWDGGQRGGPIATAWGVNAWPTVYVIDEQGVIRFEKVRGDALDEAVDELLERSAITLAEYRQSDDPKLRALATFRMAKYDLPDAKILLTELQKNDNAIVRQRVAAGLALLGEPTQRLLPLLRDAITDSDRSVRLAALHFVAAAADQEATSRVIDATKDKEVKVRRAAIEALGQLNDPSGVSAVAEACDDQDARTAKLAALTLAKFEAAEAIAHLEELADRADHPARIWIAMALHRHDQTATKTRFQKFLESTDVALRREATAALADVPDFDATDLQIIAMEDKDAEVRKTAATALSKSEDPRAAEALERHYTAALDDLLPQLSETRKVPGVMAQLHQLGPAAAPFLLDRLFGQATPGTENYIAAAIGNLANPAVVPRVIEKLRDDGLSGQPRGRLEELVMGVGSKALHAILPLADHDSVVVRTSAIRMLTPLKDDEAIATLKVAMKDSDLNVRSIAAGGLARHKDPDALPVLLQMAKGDERGPRVSAARALVNYDAEVALPVLLELSKHEDPMTRSTVVSSLGHFNDKAATEAILRISREQPNVGIPGVFALRRQGTPEAVQAMGELMKTGNDSVRQFAERYLRSLRTTEADRVLEEAAAVVAATPAPKMPLRFRAGTTVVPERPRNAVARPMVIPEDHDIIEGWGRPVDPDGDCAFNVDNDGMTIRVPGTPHDLSIELNRMNAPRVLQDVDGRFHCRGEGRREVRSR